MLAAAVPARTGKRRWNWAPAPAPPACAWQRVCRGLVITGVEIDAELAALANEQCRRQWRAGAFCRRRHLRFAAGTEARFRSGLLPIRPFMAKARHRPMPPRAAALMDDGRLGDWLQAGLQRTVSGGFFTAILRADRLNEALAALPERASRLSALAARRRGGQAGDRAGAQGFQGAVCPAARAGFAPGGRRLDPGGRRDVAARQLRLPCLGPVCRFRPISRRRRIVAKARYLSGPYPHPAELSGRPRAA